METESQWAHPSAQDDPRGADKLVEGGSPWRHICTMADPRVLWQCSTQHCIAKPLPPLKITQVQGELFLLIRTNLVGVRAGKQTLPENQMINSQVDGVEEPFFAPKRILDLSQKDYRIYQGQHKVSGTEAKSERQRSRLWGFEEDLGDSHKADW